MNTLEKTKELQQQLENELKNELENMKYNWSENGSYFLDSEQLVKLVKWISYKNGTTHNITGHIKGYNIGTIDIKVNKIESFNNEYGKYLVLNGSQAISLDDNEIHFYTSGNWYDISIVNAYSNLMLTFKPKQKYGGF